MTAVELMNGLMGEGREMLLSLKRLPDLVNGLNPKQLSVVTARVSELFFHSEKEIHEAAAASLKQLHVKEAKKIQSPNGSSFRAVFREFVRNWDNVRELHRSRFDEMGEDLLKDRLCQEEVACIDLLRRYEKLMNLVHKNFQKPERTLAWLLLQVHVVTLALVSDGPFQLGLEMSESFSKLLGASLEIAFPRPIGRVSAKKREETARNRASLEDVIRIVRGAV